MIDQNTEALIDFNNVSEKPYYKDEEKPTYHEIIKDLAYTGIKGVKLDCIEVNGSVYTSIEALLRFTYKVSICEFCLDMFGLECGYDEWGV